MTEYRSAADFASKVEWEGGIDDAFEYGLKHTDLDPNDEGVADLRAKWAELGEIYRHTALIKRQIQSLLNNIEEGIQR